LRTIVDLYFYFKLSMMLFNRPFEEVLSAVGQAGYVNINVASMAGCHVTRAAELVGRNRTDMHKNMIYIWLI
jgi:hypothetical protein